MKTLFLLFAFTVLSLSSVRAGVTIAGELIVDVSAAALNAPANGSAVLVWPNNGTLGGVFVPAVAGSGAVYTSDVGGVPAVTFSRSEDTILTNTIPTPAALTGNAVFSVESWIFNPSLDDDIETWLSWTPRTGLAVNDGTVAEFRYGKNTENAVEHYTSIIGWDITPAMVGVWHHLAITRAADGTEKLFVDGHLRKARSFKLNLRADGSIALGGVYSASSLSWIPSYRFSGSLSAVRIHSGTLSDAQVRDNYLADAATYQNVRTAADGAWSDATKWAKGEVPDTNDPVLIANGGTIRLSEGAQSIESLDLLEGSLVIDGGASLTISNTINHTYIGRGATASLGISNGVFRCGNTVSRNLYCARGAGSAFLRVGGGSDPAELDGFWDFFGASDAGSRSDIVIGNGGRVGVGSWFYLASGVGASASMTVKDGAVVTGRRESNSLGRKFQLNFSGAQGTLTLDGGLLNAGVDFCFSGYSTETGVCPTASGIVILNGGVLETARISVGSSGSTNRLYLNGGTIRAAASAGDYLTGLTSASVQSGGVTFDVPSGVVVTVAQPFSADPDAPGGVIRKTGEGRLILTGANTVPTAFELAGGSVSFASADALSFTSIDAAPGTSLLAPYAGGPSALLARLDTASAANIILTTANAADDLDLTGRANQTFSFEGHFAYTGTVTPADASQIVFDVGSATITNGASYIGNYSLTVKGNRDGRLVLTSASDFAGGLTVDTVCVEARVVSALPSSGPVTLLNRGSIVFSDTQDVKAFVARLTADSDGILLLGRPESGLTDIDLSALPGVTLGAAYGTNVVVQSLTPAASTYRLGGGGTPYTGSFRGLILNSLADVNGSTKVVIEEPGLVRLAAGNTYSGGTIVSNGASVFLSDDGLGAVPEVVDPVNLTIDRGTVRGGEGEVSLPATRGVYVAPGGARFHEWGAHTFLLNGNLSGSGPLTMSDSGWVTFGGADNSFTGALTVESGANTRIGTGPVFSWTDGPTVNLKGRLALNSDGPLTVTQVFSGWGTLRKEGKGEMLLRGNQAYCTTEVSGGVLRVAPGSWPYDGSKGRLTIQNSGIFETDRQGLTIAALAGNGIVTNRSGAADTLTIKGTADLTATFSGVVDDTISVVKMGMCTQIFTSTSLPLKDLTVGQGVTVLDRSQNVSALTITGGVVEVRNGVNGLLGRYYNRTSSTVGKSYIASIGAIDALEAEQAPDYTESSACFGADFDTGTQGSAFPGGYASKDHYIVVWRGSFLALKEGVYTFSTASDDGSAVFVDGQLVVNNLNDQSYTGSDRVNKRSNITLTKGNHSIVIAMYDKSGFSAITVFLQEPGEATDKILPNRLLSTTESAASVVKSIETHGGSIRFSDYGFPAITFDLSDAAEISIPVHGGTKQALLTKTGLGTLLMKGADSDFAGTFAVNDGVLALEDAATLGTLDVAPGAVVRLPETSLSGDGLTMKYYLGVTTFDYANFTDLSRLETWTNERTPDLVTNSLSSGETVYYGKSGAPFHMGVDRFVVYMEGFIRIDVGGTYGFGMNSDDGGVVWIDGKLVVSRAMDIGLTASPEAGSTGIIALTAGLHKIQIGYREAAGDEGLRLFIKYPGGADYVRLPQSVLQYGTSAAYGLAGDAGATFDFGERGRFMVLQDSDTVYSGALCGGVNASLIKCGSGTLTLAGDSSAFSGDLRVSEGLLTVGPAFSLVNVRVCSDVGGTFLIDRAGPVPLRALTGAGRLVIDGGADVIVSGSLFTGTVEIRNGTFTTAATGLHKLSTFAGAISNGVWRLIGDGVFIADLAPEQMGAKLLSVEEGATLRPFSETTLNGASINLSDGTLELATTILPGEKVLADFTDLSAWAVNGSALAMTGPANYFQLTQDAQNKAGTIFRKEKVNVAQTWYASFHADISSVGAPADGFAFMLQNDASGTSALGGNGGCKGGATYETASKKVMQPAVSAVFNIYNGVRFSWAVDGKAIASEVKMDGFISTNDFDVVITYDGRVLSAEVTQGSRIFTHSCEMDFASYFTDGLAYVGFTAATGGSCADQTIRDFRMSLPAAADAAFGNTAVTVADGVPGVLATQFAVNEFGSLALGADSSLTLTAAAGAGKNVDWSVFVKTFAFAPESRVTVVPGGTETGTLVLSVLDCRAGGVLTMSGGRLAAKDDALTIVVSTPLARGLTNLIDLRESKWVGEKPEMTLIDAEGNPVKGNVFLSGGFLKIDTTPGTLMICVNVVFTHVSRKKAHNENKSDDPHVGGGSERHRGNVCLDRSRKRFLDECRELGRGSHPRHHSNIGRRYAR